MNFSALDEAGSKRSKEILEKLEDLQTEMPSDFSEGGEKISEIIKEFKAHLKGLPDRVPAGPHATRRTATQETDTDIDRAREKKIHEFMAADKELTYRDALQKVGELYPELIEEI